LLYPLFVHNIGAFLYHPTNTHRTHAVMAAAERRRADSTVLTQSQALNQGTMQRRASDLIPSSQASSIHHQGLHNPMHGQHPNMSQQPRPELQRSISFPTPPSSASSVMGVGGSDGQSFWGGGSVSSVGVNANGSLAIDTVMNSARSMPTTPATTPPGGLQAMQQYPPPSNTMYQSSQAPMSQQNMAQQQNMQRFNQPLPQPNQYMGQNRDTSTMGPPARGPASRPSSRQEVKEDVEENGLAGEGEDHGVHGVCGGVTSAKHVHEEEYTTHDNGYPNGHRSNVYYPPLTTEHPPHLSPDMTGSPGHGQTPSTPARPPYGGNNASVPRTVENGTGATPRTTSTASQQQWVGNGTGYSTPPRSNSASGAAIRHPPSRNLYQLVPGDPSADQGDTNGPAPTDTSYAPQLASQASPQSFGGVNGAATPTSNKRVRELDDDEDAGSRPGSRDHDDRPVEGEGAGLKRRKTIREGSTSSNGMGGNTFDRSSDGRLNRARSAVGPRRTGR
jgi:protein SOK2